MLSEDIKEWISAGSAAILLIICVCGIVLIASWMTGANPNQGHKIVSCSDYREITDVYKTPQGKFVKFEGSSYGSPCNTAPICDEMEKGKYYRSDFISQRVVNLKHLSENETGMRDACEEIP